MSAYNVMSRYHEVPCDWCGAPRGSRCRTRGSGVLLDSVHDKRVRRFDELNVKRTLAGVEPAQLPEGDFRVVGVIDRSDGSTTMLEQPIEVTAEARDSARAAIRAEVAEQVRLHGPVVGRNALMRVAMDSEFWAEMES